MKKWVITLFILLLVCVGWGYLYILDFQKQIKSEQGRSSFPNSPPLASMEIEQTTVYVYPEPSDSSKTRIVYLAELKNSGNRYALITDSKIIYKRKNGKILKINKQIETVPQWGSLVRKTYVRDSLTINEKLTKQDIKTPQLKLTYKLKENTFFPYIKPENQTADGSKVEGILINKTRGLDVQHPIVAIGLYNKEMKLIGVLKTDLNNQLIEPLKPIHFSAEDTEKYMPETILDQIYYTSPSVQNGEVTNH